MGHVVYGRDECPTSMVNAFIIDPTNEPDASCLEDVSLKFMIPGEASEIALEPFANEDMGYTTLIPTGWEEIIPGAYSRGNPAIDPTLLAQLSSPNETAEAFLGEYWLIWASRLCRKRLSEHWIRIPYRGQFILSLATRRRPWPWPRAKPQLTWWR